VFQTYRPPRPVTGIDLLFIIFSRMHDATKRQPYERKVLRVQRNLPYGDSGACHMFEIQSSSFLMLRNGLHHNLMVTRPQKCSRHSL
jgi:hypothetical protein